MQSLRVIFVHKVLSSSWRSLAVCIVCASSFSFASAQDAVVIEGKDMTMLAEVISVEEPELKDVPNTGTKTTYQTVRVRLLSGELKGREVRISDSPFVSEVGDRVYVRYMEIDGSESFSVQEPYRLHVLLWMLLGFIAIVLAIGGKQGFLSLLALFISFGGIFKWLFPQILTGGNVVWIAALGALLSLFVVMFLTHGFTRLTASAFLGCVASVLATLAFAQYAVKWTRLTGFASEESVYLNLATSGQLDFVALLVGGIIIGVIGVIDDVAITQASVVRELTTANPNLSAQALYAKALKVGKDHMGAVINTLILAYTGAALPLVLLLYVSTAPALELINREVITTEIVRGIVGSTGLILAVPLTTLIAVALMYKKDLASVKGHAH